MSLFAASNAIHWTPSDAILPMQCVRRGSRIGGVLVSLFALAWCGTLLACIVAGTLQEGVNVAMTLLLLGFALPGLLFLWVGLNTLFGRREVFIDRQQVTVRERGLRRTRSWSEPLSAYAGVLRRVVHHSGGRNSTSWTERLVVLAHESPEREIPLFEARAGVGVKELQTETWRRLGTLLERPLLEQNAEGVFAIDAESFDAPLREKLRAEDAATPATLSDLGGRVVVTCDGNATVFASRRFRNCWKGALGLAITLAMLAVGRHIEATEPSAEGIGIFVWMMYGFVAMFVLAFATELLGREDLRIDRAYATHRLRYGLWTRERSLAVDEIRAVSVKRDERGPSGSHAVVIEGKKAVIRFGESLPKATLIGVKGRVLALLAEDTGASPRDAAVPVKIGDPVRAARARLVWVPVAILAFFALLGVLMHLAFDSESGGPAATGAPSVGPGVISVEPVREAPAERRPLDTPRNALIQSWHRHYKAAEEAVARQDYALAEQEFRAALTHAERLGPDEPMLTSTVNYLRWVLERRGSTGEGRELGDHAAVLRGSTSR